MRLKPKEILPTVIGTVLTLTALVAVTSPKQTAVVSKSSVDKIKVCCADKAECRPAT
jgi:hypothetical protein